MARVFGPVQLSRYALQFGNNLMRVDDQFFAIGEAI